MNEFYGQDWQAVLNNNKLHTFDDLWSLQTDWFEEPNVRRGGWSGVVKLDLKTSNKNNSCIFIKRQQNHISKTLFHPIKGIATFEKEFHNIQRFKFHNIPTLDVAYFSSQQSQGNNQAILVTKALEGYYPLDSETFSSIGPHRVSPKDKQQLVIAIAHITRNMHRHHLQHNCFYPKHIFAKKQDDGWLVTIIDLEKAKRTLFKRSALVRDLSTLSRHAHNWSLRDRITFFKAYVNEDKLSAKSKRLWRVIENKVLSKAK